MLVRFVGGGRGIRLIAERASLLAKAKRLRSTTALSR